jgi:hypothetical protein
VERVQDVDAETRGKESADTLFRLR